jgi:hypothetical protein
VIGSAAINPGLNFRRIARSMEASMLTIEKRASILRNRRKKERMNALCHKCNHLVSRHTKLGCFTGECTCEETPYSIELYTEIEALKSDFDKQTEYASELRADLAAAKAELAQALKDARYFAKSARGLADDEGYNTSEEDAHLASHPPAEEAKK